jgi:hypothetical protein
MRHGHRLMFQVLVPVLGRQTAEAGLLAGVEVEVEGEVEPVAAVNYLKKIDQTASVRGAGYSAELLALLLTQPMP